MTPLLSRKEDYEVRPETETETEALIMVPGEPSLRQESLAGARARPGPRTWREGRAASSSQPGAGLQ